MEAITSVVVLVLVDDAYDVVRSEGVGGDREAEAGPQQRRVELAAVHFEALDALASKVEEGVALACELEVDGRVAVIRLGAACEVEPDLVADIGDVRCSRL